MQLTVVSLLLCYLSVANAFYFYLAGGERKCFYKELSRGTLLVGNYDVEVFDQNTESFTKATQKQLGVIIDVEVCMAPSPGFRSPPNSRARTNE